MAPRVFIVIAFLWLVAIVAVLCYLYWSRGRELDHEKEQAKRERDDRVMQYVEENEDR